MAHWLLRASQVHEYNGDVPKVMGSWVRACVKVGLEQKMSKDNLLYKVKQICCLLNMEHSQ